MVTFGSIQQPILNMEICSDLKVSCPCSDVLVPLSGPANADLTGILGSKPEEIHAKFKIAKERTHHAFESRLHYRVHGYSELV